MSSRNRIEARGHLKRKIPLILLLFLGLIVAAWIVLRPKPAPAPVLLIPTPRRLAQAETHIAELGKAVSNPGPNLKHNPRTLRLSENDLNVYLAGSKSVRKLLASRGVEAVQIVLAEPANVIVHATVRVNSHPQNIQIDGSLEPDPKTGLRFRASSAQVGSLPLPPSVVTAQANALAAHFTSQLHRSFSISVQSVSVQKKDLVIVGLPIAAASPQSVSPARH
ncbi:MAG: hypothetical protein ACRYFS_03550 [Janthinobacterium lividum]